MQPRADASSPPQRMSPPERLAMAVSRFTGKGAAFAIAFGLVLVWIVTGPAFVYADTWELVSNTSTTIWPFLMVFLIDRSQNKEAVAMQLNLNEIVAALE